MTMAEAAATGPASEPVRYVEIWIESLAQVLGQINGSPLPCAALPQPALDSPTPESSATDAAAAEDLWMVGTCAGGVRGELSLRFPAATTLRLAQIFMSEPPSPGAELTADHRDATVELLRQVAGIVVSALKPSWGEVQLRLDASPGAPSWPASSTTRIGIGDDSSIASWLEMQLSAALVAGLRAGKAESAKTESAPAASSVASHPSSPEENRAKLDLLMDVELALTLRFGSRRLLLREVLDLNPGAVVELDRQVEEPVDVLLDGRLVARGEVVVLDGNYGVRITEVAPAS
jgi:flagellar motor switch protein FliN